MLFTFFFFMTLKNNFLSRFTVCADLYVTTKRTSRFKPFPFPSPLGEIYTYELTEITTKLTERTRNKIRKNNKVQK